MHSLANKNFKKNRLLMAAILSARRSLGGPIVVPWFSQIIEVCSFALNKQKTMILIWSN